MKEDTRDTCRTEEKQKIHKSKTYLTKCLGGGSMGLKLKHKRKIKYKKLI